MVAAMLFAPVAKQHTCVGPRRGELWPSSLDSWVPGFWFLKQLCFLKHTGKSQIVQLDDTCTWCWCDLFLCGTITKCSGFTCSGFTPSIEVAGITTWASYHLCVLFVTLTPEQYRILTLNALSSLTYGANSTIMYLPTVLILRIRMRWPNWSIPLICNARQIL